MVVQEKKRQMRKRRRRGGRAREEVTVVASELQVKIPDAPYLLLSLIIVWKLITY